jgi:hypothetical protein
MSERRTAVLAAGQAYAMEIERKFPGAKTEVLLESVGGHDAWIRIELPPRLHDSHEDVLDATAELNEQYSDSKGIHLIATIQEVEAVPHG